MIAPSWLRTDTQPIGIDAVDRLPAPRPRGSRVARVAKSRSAAPTSSPTREMLDRMAIAMGKQPRRKIPVPLDHALALGPLARPSHARRSKVARPLVEGLTTAHRRHRTRVAPEAFGIVPELPSTRPCGERSRRNKRTTGSNPRPRAWEACALPAELRPRWRDSRTPGYGTGAGTGAFHLAADGSFQVRCLSPVCFESGALRPVPLTAASISQARRARRRERATRPLAIAVIAEAAEARRPHRCRGGRTDSFSKLVTLPPHSSNIVIDARKRTTCGRTLRRSSFAETCAAIQLRADVRAGYQSMNGEGWRQGAGEI